MLVCMLYTMLHTLLMHTIKVKLIGLTIHNRVPALQCYTVYVHHLERRVVLGYSCSLLLRYYDRYIVYTAALLFSNNI